MFVRIPMVDLQMSNLTPDVEDIEGPWLGVV